MKLKFGVPCSKIKDEIKDVEINCTSEDEAMAIAAGCILAGEKPTVYMQNSGFARCLDVLTSLYLPYEIEYPKLILSIRHKPFHHAYIGDMTIELLKMLEYVDIDIIEQRVGE